MIQATKFIVDPAWRIIFKDMGIKEEQVLKYSQLPLDLFSREKAYLTSQEYFRLWESLEQLMEPACFPLKIAQSITAEAFSPPIFASLCSPNLNIAMTRLSRFKQLIGPMTLKVEKDPQETSLIIDCLHTDQPLPESLAVMELVFLTHLVRLGTREFIVPTHVSATTELSDINEYATYFGRMPVKGQYNQVKFSAQDATRPFLTDNPGMWSFFEPELRKRLSDLKQDLSYTNRVRSLLYELLPSGRGSMENVAKELAVSKRSLQRYLKNEGTSFQRELNKTREKLALHYLHNSNLPGAQISFLLGFDDPNSFVRAFRSWTGTTPEKIRSQRGH